MPLDRRRFVEPNDVVSFGSLGMKRHCTSGPVAQCTAACPETETKLAIALVFPLLGAAGLYVAIHACCSNVTSDKTLSRPATHTQPPNEATHPSPPPPLHPHPHPPNTLLHPNTHTRAHKRTRSRSHNTRKTEEMQPHGAGAGSFLGTGGGQIPHVACCRACSPVASSFKVPTLLNLP